ncbi:hypothetical protein ERW49_18810 [Aliivibrio finisterrensis]|uniref:Uncharacterized protein n=1 Tax=Aliivibrio finisterrensis TaxID=511998 RepID=A0A4V1Z6A3_9GAMM|nr:hypothetical protein [Aliivibrio finisterrensis]RYU41120.1 hypothetical protein ERW49_18810 [Aliivibrio finisterrensis]
MAIICGVPDDDGISDFLKCAITQNIGGTEVTVMAYMTEECRLSLNSVWESPFDGDSVGNAGIADKFSNIAQVKTGATSKTQLNSHKVWEGMEPPEASLTLTLHAYTNAQLEVDDPIQYLLQMASPDLREETPVGVDGSLGRVPGEAMFNVGRKFIMPMVISNVTYNLNAPKTPQNNYAYNTVTLTVSPKTMINKSEVPNKFL